MKREAVAAPRSTRGLRPGRRDAEPQVAGLALKTTKEWKAETIESGILRNPNSVEPQKPATGESHFVATGRLLSLAPGFSRVCSTDANENRFNGFRALDGSEAVKTACPAPARITGLKPGANEICKKMNCAHCGRGWQLNCQPHSQP